MKRPACSGPGKTGSRIHVRTPFNLFPLITGRMPPGITRRLVDHLTNEKEFWPPFPVPSVALDDPKYDPNQMWRGPTWVNINYLIIEGLRNAGYPEVSTRAAPPHPGADRRPKRYLRILSPGDR